MRRITKFYFLVMVFVSLSGSAWTGDINIHELDLSAQEEVFPGDGSAPYLSKLYWDTNHVPVLNIALSKTFKHNTWMMDFFADVSKKNAEGGMIDYDWIDLDKHGKSWAHENWSDRSIHRTQMEHFRHEGVEFSRFLMGDQASNSLRFVAGIHGSSMKWLAFGGVHNYSTEWHQKVETIYIPVPISNETTWSNAKEEIITYAWRDQLYYLPADSLGITYHQTWQSRVFGLKGLYRYKDYTLKYEPMIGYSDLVNDVDHHHHRNIIFTPDPKHGDFGSYSSLLLSLNKGIKPSLDAFIEYRFEHHADLRGPQKACLDFDQTYCDYYHYDSDGGNLTLSLLAVGMKGSF